MQQSDDDGNPPANGHEGSVSDQFGDLMRRRREDMGWSQRQLAEALRTVDLRLDPSAVTRIERGTRDVKLTEAIAIASVLQFNLDEISFSPEQHFRMREWTQLELVIRARRTLLDALRHFDRWANNTDPETEERLVKRLGLTSISELYTHMLKQSPAFKRGGRLGHHPNDGDNYAISYNETDHEIKQTTIDLVTADILVTEGEFEEIVAENRRRLGRGLASLIPNEPPQAESDESET